MRDGHQPSIGQPVATGARAILAGSRMPDPFSGEMERREMDRKSEYAKKFLDPRWQQFRLRVYERDGFSCMMCGCSTRTLHGHHSYYEWGRDPWDYPEESVVTLCDECHEGEHANWDCDEIRAALCCNGFWSVYDRMFLAGAIRGDIKSHRPLDREEADRLCRVVEAFAWSCRNEEMGVGLANRLLQVAHEAPSMLPGQPQPGEHE